LFQNCFTFVELFSFQLIFRLIIQGFTSTNMAAPLSNAISDQPMLKADDRLAGLAHSEGPQICLE